MPSLSREIRLMRFLVKFSRLRRAGADHTQQRAQVISASTCVPAPRCLGNLHKVPICAEPLRIVSLKTVTPHSLQLLGRVQSVRERQLPRPGTAPPASALLGPVQRRWAQTVDAAREEEPR
jgi:hypothetical protein